MAGVSALSSMILHQRMSLAQVMNLQQRDMEKMLGLDEIAFGRTKCLMLGLHAFWGMPQPKPKVVVESSETSNRLSAVESWHDEK
jgi:hypothetical protein